MNTLREICPKSEDKPWSPSSILTESKLREVAHLPLLTMIYLKLQRQASATPVTALELAAYLGVEVKVAEDILSFLEKRGIVHAFREDLPAYSLNKKMGQITGEDFLALLVDFFQLVKNGQKFSDSVPSDDKYRKLYSKLASEILLLFGQESVNQLPV